MKYKIYYLIDGDVAVPVVELGIVRKLGEDEGIITQ